MLRGLPPIDPVTGIFSEATHILGRNPLEYDDDLALSSTSQVHIAIFIAEIAVLRLLADQGATPDAVAGSSLGAFAAAVACGSLTFEQALPIVRLRGELMQEAYPEAYGMAVILGLNERRVAAIVERSTTTQAPVFVTNVNAPDQVLVSGSDAGMTVVLRRALEAGARKAKRLRISVPSHCSLLTAISERLGSALSTVHMSTPEVPYVSSRGRPLRDADSIRNDLSTSIKYPVRWYDATSVLFELGVRLFLELPPGQTLTDLAVASFPSVRSIAFENYRLDSVVNLIKRQKLAT